MLFEIIRNDITKIEADAIVNTANPSPIIGRGTDGKIYEAAGREKLLAARKNIGEIKCGDAKITPAFDLHAKFIIHTVAPVWQGGNSGEVDILRKCYKNSLALAFKNDCKSIAFPLLAAGINNFPKETALSIAVNEICNFVFEHDLFVTLAVFDNESFSLSKRIYSGVAEFVDDKVVTSAELKEYRGGGLDYWRRKHKQNTKANVPAKSFSQCLFEKIDERGLTNPQVYKRADVIPKVFSDIRRKKNYHPKRKTAVSLAIALKLSLPETQELLAAAGYILSNSLELDVAIMDFISRGVYDIDKINCELHERNLPILKVKNTDGT